MGMEESIAVKRALSDTLDWPCVVELLRFGAVLEAGLETMPDDPLCPMGLGGKGPLFRNIGREEQEWIINKTFGPGNSGMIKASRA